MLLRPVDGAAPLDHTAPPLLRVGRRFLREFGIDRTAVEEYAVGLIPARDAPLLEVERAAEERRLPIVGPLEGQFLHALARATGARTVLELGTCTGYSAVWFGRAVAGRGGKVVTVEYEPERAREARRNVERCGLAGVVDVREGDALAVLTELTEQFDLVFNDLLRSFPDEARMRRLFELSLARVRPGGVLLADNALHGGEVVAPGDKAGPRAVALYNRLAAEHPELTTVLVPIRDGVALSYRHG
ncbi:MAG TPA: O-methyltransferase [Chloroflexota bacterium]|jgi:predicted O-methyltransferase YrrM|nr:O-methyltransferase [Chloroflexota bacterium]